MESMRKRLNHFWNCDSGSFTIESVIWMPIFFILMALTMNLSMMFFSEAQILRVVQQVSRAHSLGLYKTDLEAENDLVERLSYFGAKFDVAATKTFNRATATVQVSATDLMPMHLMSAPFTGTKLNFVSNRFSSFWKPQ